MFIEEPGRKRTKLQIVSTNSTPPTRYVILIREKETLQTQRGQPISHTRKGREEVIETERDREREREKKK